MKTLALSALLVIATAFVAAEQQQVVPRPPAMPGGRDTSAGPMPTGTASLTGQILSGVGGRPMRRATVRLQSSTSPMSRTTTTDDHGNYEFKDLPAGEFTLRANKPGYLESIYGQKRPGSGRPGTPVSLKDAQRLEKIDVTIPKGGVITGTITDDVGEPAFGVQVRAMRYAYRNGERSLVNAGTASTDDRGIYRIPTLAPGEYIVMATPRDDSGPLGDLAGIEQKMTAAIGGGVRTMVTSSDISSLMPSPNENPPSTGYAPVFFPGTTLATGASTITVGPAEEKPGLDVQLQLVPLGTITGFVMGDPRAVQATTVELADSNSGLPGLSAKTARPAADGKFTFTGVAPGQYTLTAKSGGNTMMSFDNGGGSMRMTFVTQQVDGGPMGRGAGPGGPAAPPQWAKAEVNVEGRAKNEVTLSLQPGMSVSGQVRFEGTGAAPTDFSSMKVLLASAVQGGVMSGSSFANVDSDGRFKVSDVMPGRYKVTITPPRGWRAKTIDVDARDTLDFMLDVKAGEDIVNATAIFTNKPAEVSGTLQDSTGKPTSDYTIILFAAEQKYWTPQSRRIVSTRPSTDGKFSFRDLPAGDYKLIALDDAEPDSWFDVNFLRQILGPAMSVTIVEGEKKMQDIKVK